MTKNRRTGISATTDIAKSALQSDLPVEFDEAAKPELHGVLADVVEIDQRPEEVVPGPDEGEDRSRRKSRHGERQDDAPIDAPGPCPVDDRRLVELARDAAEELVEEEDEEGVDSHKLRHDEGKEGVDPIEVEEEDVLRDQRDVVRQHQRAEHHREPEILQRELKPREGIGRKRARDHVADHAQHRDDRGVPEERPEADRQAAPAAPIGVGSECLGQYRRVAEDLVVGLEARREHPEQRIEHDERDRAQEDMSEERTRPALRPPAEPRRGDITHCNAPNSER